MTAKDNEPSFSDPEMIRALAHPARTAVLDYLGSHDEATATECAEVAGLSPSAMSYHLRTLAKVGLLEEAGGRGDGRERVWRRKVKSFSVGVEYDAPPSVQLSGRAMVEAFQSVATEKMRRWLDKAPEASREWYDTMTFSQSSITVTAEEAKELARGYFALLEPFIKRREEGTPPEGSRAVAVQVRIFPEG